MVFLWCGAGVAACHPREQQPPAQPVAAPPKPQGDAAAPDRRVVDAQAIAEDAQAPVLDGGASPSPVAMPLSEKNWRNHPAIVEIRSMCEKVERDIAQKSLRADRRKYSCLPGETERSAFVELDGRVRKLTRAGGSEDSAMTVEQCFDESGQLRFAYVVAGAANESQLQVRLYFDPSGRPLWQDRKLIGPGYTWSFDHWLMRRAPKNAFADEPHCR